MTKQIHIVEDFERMMISEHEFYLDANLWANMRRVVQGLFTDIEVVGLLPTYSSFCYLTSSLILLFLLSKNIRARRVDCGAVIKNGSDIYTLGLGQAQPGQINAHAACIVEDRVLLDFGMGAVSKYLLPGFPQGIVCRTAGADGSDHLAVAKLPNGQEIIWTPIPEPPEKKNLLIKQQSAVNSLYERWQRAIDARR